MSNPQHLKIGGRDPFSVAAQKIVILTNPLTRKFDKIFFLLIKQFKIIATLKSLFLIVMAPSPTESGKKRLIN